MAASASPSAAGEASIAGAPSGKAGAGAAEAGPLRPPGGGTNVRGSPLIAADVPSGALIATAGAEGNDVAPPRAGAVPGGGRNALGCGRGTGAPVGNPAVSTLPGTLGASGSGNEGPDAVRCASGGGVNGRRGARGTPAIGDPPGSTDAVIAGASGRDG
jgi:hypothetical protein